MNIALIGYGKMGKEIEKIALKRKHSIQVIIDQDNIDEFNTEKFRTCDVAIEFTNPESAISNFHKCFDAKVPVVSGTTGWLKKWDDIINYCNTKESGFFYASNFSIGVNILFYLNEQLAKIMNQYPDYNIDIEETHHTQKLDAPSGTAISLANDLINNIDRKTEWKLDETNVDNQLKIKANRIENIPGEHTIKYESDVDIIRLNHAAKSRVGFALGAVMAAEFMNGKSGVYSMKDLLKF